MLGDYCGKNEIDRLKAINSCSQHCNYSRYDALNRPLSQSMRWESIDNLAKKEATILKSVNNRHNIFD